VTGVTRTLRLPPALRISSPCPQPARPSLAVPCSYDIVARFNGGANAGHTVIANGKKFAFHLLPCGLIYPHTQNLLGNGVVVDLDALDEESVPLDKEGIEWRDRLFVSDRAHLLCTVSRGFHRSAVPWAASCAAPGAPLPAESPGPFACPPLPQYHKELDGIQETRRSTSGKAIGTTKKGIGPCYTAKASRTPALRVGDLRDWEKFAPRFRSVVAEYQAQFDFEYDTEGELERLREQSERLQPMIVDGVHMINEAYANGRRIITEGANALMLDVDFGTYPYVTSSSTGAGGICTGLGLAPSKIETTVGVMKAYTTRVGGGPFPTELTDERGGGDLPLNAPGTDIGLHLQTVGAEIGVT